MRATWRVWCPDLDGDEDDARTFAALDAQDAAQEWADWEDRTSAEYLIVGGTDREVHVRGPDGQVTRWLVSGRSEAAYYAREVTR